MSRCPYHTHRSVTNLKYHLTLKITAIFFYREKLILCKNMTDILSAVCLIKFFVFFCKPYFLKCSGSANMVYMSMRQCHSDRKHSKFFTY